MLCLANQLMSLLALFAASPILTSNLSHLATSSFSILCSSRGGFRGPQGG